MIALVCECLLDFIVTCVEYHRHTKQYVLNFEFFCFEFFGQNWMRFWPRFRIWTEQIQICPFRLFSTNMSHYFTILTHSSGQFSWLNTGIGMTSAFPMTSFGPNVGSCGGACIPFEYRKLPLNSENMSSLVTAVAIRCRAVEGKSADFTRTWDCIEWNSDGTIATHRFWIFWRLEQSARSLLVTKHLLLYRCGECCSVIGGNFPQNFSYIPSVRG